MRIPSRESTECRKNSGSRGRDGNGAGKDMKSNSPVPREIRCPNNHLVAKVEMGTVWIKCRCRHLVGFAV